MRQEQRAAQIEQGQAALETGDWEAARVAFEAVVAVGEDPAALEGLGYALWWLNDLPSAQRMHERAYTRYKEIGDPGRAASIAMWLSAVQRLAHGNAAASRGWLARAERLLVKSEPSVHHGWLSIYKAAASDPHAMAEHAENALVVAEQFDDIDLQVLALGYNGLARVSAGQIDEGMPLLDEAMAAATGGEMRNQIAIALVFCVMLSACHQALDLERAEQWAEIAYGLLGNDPETSFFATCRTLYGSMLTATGRWAQAEHELLTAVATFEGGYRAMRGDALVELAELRVRQGRLEEAQELLRGHEDHPKAWAPLAALFLAQGRPRLALSTLERQLRLLHPDSLEAGPLLAMLNRALVELGELDRAAQVAERLADIGRRSETVAVVALAECCTARVAAARGEDPVPRLEATLTLFSKANLPFELAEIRLTLARCLAESAHEVAVTEASLAMRAFEEMGATRHVDDAASLLRTLGAPRIGPKGRGPLTQREQEVLGLLGRGLTNQQIAKRLVISRRTAEHHVANVLAKLGLATRAEAAAYAVRMHHEEAPRS